MTGRLYIKVDENNVHIGHPRFESNMRQVMPNHDFDQGPPDGFMLFARVEPPILGVYELFDETIGGNIAVAFPHNGLSYEIIDGGYKDVWHVRAMTPEEVAAKQDEVQSSFAASRPTWVSWTFNAESCLMEPPVPHPSDGSAYAWSETQQVWVAYPHDGQNYTWDADTEEWPVYVAPE